MKRYSQGGQSEEIHKFFQELGITYGEIFEAGASHPTHWSNSRTFIEAGWKAFLMEPNAEYSKNFSVYDQSQNVVFKNEGIPLCDGGLDQVLDSFNASNDLDVLFLDLDGGEYQLIKGMNRYTPKVINVEHDVRYPASINFAPKLFRKNLQASSHAMFKLMESKGYFFLTQIANDLIFISGEFLDISLGLKKGGLEEYLLKISKQNNLHFKQCVSLNGLNYLHVLLYRADKNARNGFQYFEEAFDNLLFESSIYNATLFYWYVLPMFYSAQSLLHERCAMSDEYAKDWKDYSDVFSECFSRFIQKYSKLIE